MRAKNFLTGLLLCATIGLPQYVFAATYCPVTIDGKIRIDECKYGSNEECKQASESKKDCVADQLAPSTKAPYCLIVGQLEFCDKYYSYEPCQQAAKQQSGTCIESPYYKESGK